MTSTRLLTVDEIAEMARVTPNAVHNWRRRKASFPQPVPDITSSPHFREDEVTAWLKAHRPSLPIDALLRAGLNRELSPAREVVQEIGLAPSLLAFNRLLTALSTAPDDETDITSAFIDASPTSRQLASALSGSDLGMVRSLLSQQGLQATAEMVADWVTRQVGRSGADQFTSTHLADVIVALASPIEGRVLDPCMGSGALLRAAERSSNGRGQFFGSDIDPAIAALSSEMGSTAEPWTFRQADVLADDPFDGQRFDRVLLDAPAFTSSPATAARSTRVSGELAWVTYAAEHLSPGGIGVVVTSQKPLTSLGDGLRDRQILMRSGRLSAVVALPGLSAATGQPLAVWVLHNSDAPATDVALIDATSIPARDWTSQSTALVREALTHATPVGSPAFTDDAVRSIRVPVADLRGAGAVLLPARWLAQAERLSPASALEDLQAVIALIGEELPAALDVFNKARLTAEIGQAPVMAPWPTLADQSLFVSTCRPPAGADGPFVTASDVALSYLPPAPREVAPEATRPGAVVFSGEGPRYGAVMDYEGGHFLEAPLIAIEVDDPEGRITAEILAAWLNSPEARSMATGISQRVDVHTLEVPLFEPNDARALTVALKATASLKVSMQHLSTVSSALHTSVLASALSGVITWGQR